MAALPWLLNLGFAGSAVEETSLEVPGLEASVADTRLHARLASDGKLHAVVRDTRLHAKLPKER